MQLYAEKKRTYEDHTLPIAKIQNGINKLCLLFINYRVSILGS